MEKEKPASILIVDDESFVSDLLARYLSAEGYECATASSGEAALKMLEASYFQLVVTDIMMPGMSGMDLLTIVKRLYPNLAVIMVTSVDDRDTGILAIELGAYGFIIKPFERNEILINVANALERRRLTILGRDQWNVLSDRPQSVSVKRHPIRIPIKEAVELVRSGLDEASLMERFNLSAKALHSLLDQLVASGALRKSEVEERGSLSPGSVVIDLSKATFPDERKEKPSISAADAARCIRSGMDDSSLMKRYGISAKALRSLFRKLVAAGVVQQSELDKRMSETHTWAVLEE